MIDEFIKEKNMLRSFYITVAGLFAFVGIYAQDVCVIKGNIEKDSLRFTPKRVEKVYLSTVDEYDRMITLDSVKVKNNSFEFKRIINKNEPVMLHFITGFDNGQASVFVEPGTVYVRIRDAAYPSGCIAEGTKTNDLYVEYSRLTERCTQEQRDSLAILRKTKGDQWLDTPEGQTAWMRIGAAALIECNANRIEFLLEHNDSPLAPLMLEREISYMMDKKYNELLLNSLSPELKEHPYYRSFNNAVRAMDLQVGNELPNIKIPLADGGTAFLSDFRGKYVLLDFWASWCAPCMRELPYLIQLYEETRDKNDQFVIVSFSLDNKEKAWKDAIRAKNIGREAWIHGSDLLAWGSPAVRLLGVKAVPQIILIDPEGRAISFSLRGEEMVKRVKQIMSGDLYYQNSPDEPERFVK